MYQPLSAMAPFQVKDIMPRIQYQPDDLDKPEELVASVRSRRGGTLLNLDRMLLHSPAFTLGWNSFLKEVRSGLSIPAKLRELAICYVAALNEAEYEFHHHSPEFIKAGGTAAQLEAIRSFESVGCEMDLFDLSEQAVLRLTLEMTRSVKVSDGTFAAAQTALPDEQALVEIVGVIATYNMVSRFLVALGVEPEQNS